MDKVKKLSSKRNSVFLLENKDNIEVVKIFHDEKFYKKELTVYNILKTEYDEEASNSFYRIPKLLNFNDENQYIKYQYVFGETILSSFENYEREYNINGGIKILRLVFEWIDKFQKKLTEEKNIDQLSLVDINLNRDIINEGRMVVSLIDINFRNFIITGDILYGFDFENVSIDMRMKDFSRVLAYMMLYNPIKSIYKKELLTYLILELEKITNISIDEINKSYNAEVKKIEKRRALKK